MKIPAPTFTDVLKDRNNKLYEEVQHNKNIILLDAKSIHELNIQSFEYRECTQTHKVKAYKH